MRIPIVQMVATLRRLVRHTFQGLGGARPGREFVVQARDLGNTRPGIQLDNVGELLEYLDR